MCVLEQANLPRELMRFPSLIILLLLCSTFTAVAESSGQWVEVQSPHFEVLSDAGSGDAVRVASQFEKMRAAFHTFLPSASDGHSPIVVLALKNKKDLQALEPESYLAKGQLNVAGTFMQQPDKNYILVRLDTESRHPYSVVYHEYTHFMTRSATWMPLWMSEGLASFYENTDITDKAIFLGQPNAGEMYYLRLDKLLPLPTLFKVDYTSPYYHEEQKADVFYAESWALTHYLEVSDFEKKTHCLQDYARLLSQNVDPVVAAQQALGDLTKLQQILEGYVRRDTSNMKMFEMKTAIAVDTSSFRQRVIPQAEADAVRADVMIRNGRRKDAEALLEATLKADPNNITAHEAMGLLKYGEGDYVSARKWYGEAVQLDSKDCLAHYNFAMMSLRAGGRENDAAIESSLQTSIKLNPEFAPAYDALAMFYGSRDTKLSEAHVLNAHAIELEPGKLSYRLNAASVLSQQKQYQRAMDVLRAASKVAKTPDENALIDKRIQQLGQFQAGLEQRRTEDSPTASSASTASK